MFERKYRHYNMRKANYSEKPFITKIVFILSLKLNIFLKAEKTDILDPISYYYQSYNIF